MQQILEAAGLPLIFGKKLAFVHRKHEFTLIIILIQGNVVTSSTASAITAYCFAPNREVLEVPDDKLPITDTKLFKDIIEEGLHEKSVLTKFSDNWCGHPIFSEKDQKAYKKHGKYGYF